MKRRLGSSTKAALAGVALVAAAVAAVASPTVAEDRTALRLVLDRDGDADTLRVDDLGTLAVGETRTFTTEGGRTVAVTRDDDGWQLDVDGKQIRVDAGLPGEPGGDAVFHEVRRIEVEGPDGDTRTMVVTTGEAGDGGPVRIVRKVGPGGEHAFAFATHGLPPVPFGAERLIEKLEANARFQGLDATTRATVLEAVRESMPPPMRLEQLEGLDDAGGAERVIVLHLEEENEED